jgi:hypothetical protein
MDKRRVIGCPAVYGNLGGPFIITVHYEFVHLAFT